MTTNPIIDEINRTVDDPSVAVYLPIPLAGALIELVGGERVSEGLGRWMFPDGYWVWSDEEAVRYALEVAPDLLELA